MKRIIYSILAACHLVGIGFGQSEPIEMIQNRLNAEQATLTRSLSEIDAEKRDVLVRLQEAENMLRQADRKWMLMTARNQSLGEASLQAPLRAQVDSIYQGLGRLQQFNRELPEHLHPAEAEFGGRRTAELIPWLTPSASIHENEEALQVQIRLIDEAITRLEGLAGGRRFEAGALADEGSWSAGTIWILGPVAFFNPDEQGELGWISHKSGDIPATSAAIPDDQAGLRAAFSGKSGSVTIPADPAMPYQPKSGLPGLVEEVAKGGIWIIPILGFAFLATVSAILKGIQLRRYRTPTDRELAQVMRATHQGRTRQLPPAWSEPIRQLVGKGLQLRESGDAKLEKKIMREVYLLHPELTRFVSFIAITASVSPLLGLLGTVSGMIETFDVISVHGTRNAQMLSGGISEALITTEFGLIVAIPALVLHTLLNRRIRRLMSQLERMAQTIIGFSGKEGGSE